MIRSISYLAGGTWLLALATVAGAQPLGTFRWQLQPYCNVISVTVTQTGPTYRLEGSDDQCGAGTQASVIGTAFPNPDGTIGLGFNIIASPGGADVSVDATVSLPTASGTWRDSTGASGALVLSPGGASGGTPRPTTATIGASTINAAEVQRRVNGVCPMGQSMRAINQDGTVICAASGSGGVATVTAGAGLTGGGGGASVTLAVAFAGSGAAASAARSDHTHGVGFFNTALGTSALAVGGGQNNTALGYSALIGVTGQDNTAVGSNAMKETTSGNYNTAVGSGAAVESATGSANVAIGTSALRANLSGSENTAVGAAALFFNPTGSGNTAVGRSALMSARSSNNVAVGRDALRTVVGGFENVAVGWEALRNATGAGNTALGPQAGRNVAAGSNNVHIANIGTTGDSDVIRIGTTQAGFFAAGVYGRPVAGETDQTVLIDANGKLGTVVSSGRFKEDIRPIGAELARLQRLRPTSYRYKPELGRGDARQYGLIAEDVAEVMPELAVVDAHGVAQSVRYHVLTPLLLAEVQRLERERTDLERRLAASAADQAGEIARLKIALEALRVDRRRRSER